MGVHRFWGARSEIEQSRCRWGGCLRVIRRTRKAGQVQLRAELELQGPRRRRSCDGRGCGSRSPTQKPWRPMVIQAGSRVMSRRCCSMVEGGQVVVKW